MVQGRRNAAGRRLSLAAISLFPVIFAGCGSLREQFQQKPIETSESEWSFGSTQGRKITSDHYALHSTCRREAFVNALPAFLENCYDAYQDLLPSDHSLQKPMDTYLFCDRGDWERFTEQFSPARAATYKRIRRGGYSERGITVSHYSSQRGTLSILAHEGLHQYLEVTGRSRIPAWINEGLACYFESFDLVDGRPLFDPRRNTLRSPYLREAFVRDSLIPLKEILQTNAGVAVHGNTNHVRSYYAQEWSLVLFLLDDEAPERYRVGFKALLADLGSDALRRRAEAQMVGTNNQVSPGEAVFRSYITDDLDQFESDYREYLLNLLRLNA